jgi:hypothetical protein
MKDFQASSPPKRTISTTEQDIFFFPWVIFALLDPDPKLCIIL